ncbi:MAG: GNAT family N-acetyltransferase [Sporolactobacillus sp.]
MLIRYKKSYEKIAMGLLSFIPSEKEIKTVFQTIRKYEEDENWQLFLWKASEDIVGVIGVQFSDPQHAAIRHISVNPSYREEGIGKEMILALRSLLGESINVVADESLKDFFESCVINREKEETGK